MTCSSCGFENIRNSIVCARCGARLVWCGPRGRRNFTPPRAGMGKFLYPLRFFLRAKLPLFPKWLSSSMKASLSPATIPASIPSSFRVWARMPRRRGVALLLSLTPGLGDCLLGNRNRGLVLFTVWLAVLALTWFSPFPLFAAAFIALLLHISAVVCAMELNLFCRTRREIIAVVLPVILTLSSLYLLSLHAVQSRFMLMRVNNNIRLWKPGLSFGDTLLVRTGISGAGPGKLVVIDAFMGRATLPDGTLAPFGQRYAMAVWLGGAGSVIDISPYGFRVNGMELSGEFVHLIPHTPGKKFTLSVDDASFAALPLEQGQLRNALVYPATSLVGQVDYVFYPFNKRRSMEYIQAFKE